MSVVEKYKTKGKNSEQADTNSRLLAAYDAVCEAEESLQKIEKNIENALPNIIDPCQILQITEKLTGLADEMIKVQNVMTTAVNNALSATIQQGMQEVQNMTDKADKIITKQEQKITTAISEVESEITDKMDKITTNLKQEEEKLEIDQQYTKYLATQIILKKFQIIKLRIEYVKVGVQITTETLIKNVYISMLSGKGSALDPNISEQISNIQKAAQAVNTVSNAISTILAMINSLTILNVNGAGMAFFPTPKSITKTDINIANANQSVTNFIPNEIDLAIEQAGQLFKKNRGIEKKAKIAAMGATAAASVADGGTFNPGNLGGLSKFDANAIKSAINTILQTLVCAEATPRYENLKISYIRFLTFLVTGFEPAGKKTFGIPGYP